MQIQSLSVALWEVWQMDCFWFWPHQTFAANINFRITGHQRYFNKPNQRQPSYLVALVREAGISRINGCSARQKLDLLILIPSKFVPNNIGWWLGFSQNKSFKFFFLLKFNEFCWVWGSSDDSLKLFPCHFVNTSLNWKCNKPWKYSYRMMTVRLCQKKNKHVEGHISYLYIH